MNILTRHHLASIKQQTSKMTWLCTRLKMKYVLLILVSAIYISQHMGLFVQLSERDYSAEFSYPLVGNLPKWVRQLKHGQVTDVDPINNHDYTIIKSAKDKCSPNETNHIPQHVIYVVKSAMEHFGKREAIRRTWGNSLITTVFLLGSRAGDEELQARIHEEAAEHGDIVQGEFEDAYFNNTIKMMMGFRWAVEHCPMASFYLFVDDDYYISTKNLLKFLRNPIHYPSYLDEEVDIFNDNTGIMPQSSHDWTPPSRQLHQLADNEQHHSSIPLFAGYMLPTAPQREKHGKWYIDLDEYEFDQYPPSVMGGAYVLSRTTLVDFYYATYFVQRFRFDDIYLGITAKKLGIKPFHAEHFAFKSDNTLNLIDYRNVIASHGFSNPSDLEWIWNLQKDYGNA